MLGRPIQERHVALSLGIREDARVVVGRDMLAALVGGLDAKGDEAAATPLVFLQNASRAGQRVPDAHGTEPADLALGERGLPTRRLRLFQCDETLAVRDLLA